MDLTCHLQKKHDCVPVIDHRPASDPPIFYQGWNTKVGLWPSRWSSPSQGHLHNVAGWLSDTQTDSWPDMWFMDFGLLLCAFDQTCLFSNVSWHVDVCLWLRSVFVLLFHLAHLLHTIALIGTQMIKSTSLFPSSYVPKINTIRKPCDNVILLLAAVQFVNDMLWQKAIGPSASFANPYTRLANLQELTWTCY